MTHPIPQSLGSRLRPWAALSAVVLGLGALALPVQAERRPLRPASTGVESTTQAHVIVRYRSGTSSVLSASNKTGLAAVQRATALGQRVGLTLKDGLTLAPRTQVVHAEGLSSTELAAKLSADSDVEYAVPDRRRRAQAAPSDPLYAGGPSISPTSGQWYLHAASSTLVSAINAEAAWAVTPGASNVVVAVLDTGVRKDHPDLSGKLLSGYDFIDDTATANDGDGRDSDPSDPGDWITVAENLNPSGSFYSCGDSSSSWHGTQTAGLVGASTDNSVGMASIGRNVMVLPVRVLGKCGGYDSDIIAGMRWAAGLAVTGVTTNPNPAKVINMSLGSADSCNSAYQTAINEVRAQGVSVVASAGNDSLATNLPANCSGVVAVGGLRHTGTKNGYSSLGSAVTLSAPAGNCVNISGECLYPILSTSNTGTTSPVGATYTTGGNDYAVGTSFSAPLVSGTIGLMLSANANLTPDQVASKLKSTARAFPSTGAESSVAQCTAPGSTAQLECYCTTTTCGAGMLDAGAAVTSAAGSSLIAVISGSATTVAVGQTLQLSASGSLPASGRTITNYAWTVQSGASLLAITAGASSSTVTLQGLSAGTAIVALTLTDSSGEVSSSVQNVAVTSASSSSTDTTSNPDDGEDSSDGGGGGGAISPAMTAGLLVGAWALLRARRGRSAGPGSR